MVAFAGYQMPLQYAAGIIQEHLHCRESVGFFDISHMGQFLLTGKSVAKELEKLSPGNLTGLKTGQQRYALLTNEKGGIIDDIIVTRTETGFIVIVNAACKKKDLAHLKKHLSKKCKIEELKDYALFALQGPDAQSVMEQLSVEASALSFMHACQTQINDMDCLISRCGYTGEDGFEISIANQYAVALAELLLSYVDVAPVGLGARDTLRLEAGLSLYGHELDEHITPVEAGLKWTFRKQAANFLGSDILLPQIDDVNRLTRVGLTIEGKIPVRGKTELFDEKNNKVGRVTSGSFSPSLGKPIALALVGNNLQGQVLFAKVRDRTINCHITPLPFVAHQYNRT